MKKLTMTMMAITLCAAGFQACEQTTTQPTGFEWQIDRFDDIKVLRYQVPDFDSLSLRQKELIYYLSQAAVCGRDILYDQNFKYNLAIRRTLEAIYLNYKGDRSSAEFAEFEKYLKKVWFANGIHHHYSMDKFTPGFSAAYFNTLIGAIPAESLPTDFGSREALLAAIEPAIFNPTLYAKRVNLDADSDLLTTSAMHYYEGVTQPEAESFYAAQVDPRDSTPVSYGLNSRLVKENGVLTERVWKSGGMYGAAIDRIVGWLEKAATVAENDHQRETIETLIAYYRSGDLHTFDKYSVLWVGDDSQVDFVNGFIEVYGDPLGYKGSWESLVNFKNLEATKRTATISANAQWFEDHSPIEPQFRKPEVKGVSAKVITAAMLGGDCFPPTPIGINLPNSDWIRRDYGSKSVTIENITSAYTEASRGDGFNDEFVLRAEDRRRMDEYGSLADNLHTDLHECLGHGSGQLAPGVRGDELRNYGSTLEEARADLFALYYIADPKMVELGLLPSLDGAWAEYAKYVMNGLMTQLTRIQPGKNIEEAHMRNRMLIAAWCYEQGRAENVIEKRVENGKTYIVVNDFEKLRTLFGRLLNLVQHIKSTGDFAAGQALVEGYGVKVDPALHAEVLERYATLNLAPYAGFVNPVYEPVLTGGQITDIKVTYTEGYIDQMLRYSRDFSFLPTVNE
ncbi:MAG: dipeptidyl peptidase 3 [Rikenellaceae bacterium]|nr:dipeptidyl peptidase 3 [Rikenellaceae bacterium]